MKSEKLTMMKIDKQILAASLILCATLIVLSGCLSPMETSKREQPRTGYFSLISEGQNARTIVPEIRKSEFTDYTLDFFTSGSSMNGAPAESFERTAANLSENIILDVGTWDLRVRAYLNDAKDDVAAEGILKGINIGYEEITTGKVTLLAVIGAGTGTFCWNIGFPYNVSSALMIITPLDTTTETAEQQADIAASKNGSLALNTGSYHVVFLLANNENCIAERRDILHVYNGQKSLFEYNFVAEEFTNIPNDLTTEATTIRNSIDNAAGETATVTIGGVLTDARWRVILNAISLAADKKVILNLSACTPSPGNTGGGLRKNGTFDPVSNLPVGKDKIVSLKLPNAAENVTGTFADFTNLDSVVGNNVTNIEEDVFGYCKELHSVDFPNLKTMGRRAFFYCTNLGELEFPNLETMDEYAFAQCINTGRMFFPKLTNIPRYAFYGGDFGDLDFPNVITIEEHAFYNFWSSNVKIPSVQTIKSAAFEITKSLPSREIKFEMGNAPDVTACPFRDTTVSLTIVIAVPAGRIDKYTADWQIYFTGGNTNLTLMFTND